MKHLHPLTVSDGLPEPLGVSISDGHINIAVLAPAASDLYWCVFDRLHVELARVRLLRQTEGIWHGAVALDELCALPNMDGHHIYYGLRADGEYAPERGLWFDPNKLLLDPYAKRIGAPFQYHPDLAAPRSAQIDTAPLVPKAIISVDAAASLSRRSAQADAMAAATTMVAVAPITYPADTPPKFIYEVSVKALTQLHPDVPESLRGTIAALREPCVVAHFKRIGVDAVELMPIAAWMDERHLPPLGLRNAWGYNPVGMMALDPRLCPGGEDELRETVRVLYENGIRVILDVVFNHTAESDEHGPTVSLRGLDERYYYRRYWDEAQGKERLSNDAGCGNTLDATQVGVQRLCLDSLRYWVTQFGVAGFRFDLAPVLGRSASGFHPQAELLKAIENDPVLSQVWLIAEPWDIGVGGYQLGRFDTQWLEWNDRYRDAVRRFWRGDRHVLGEFATRMSGSSDLFAHNSPSTRSVNFIAAHDGMTLRDITAFEHKHNHANGENNRDGHNENYSWNHGVEGEADETIEQLRRTDVAAMLATLLLSRGTPMLMAGDEFGRTQQGNNNAYSQDNALTWLDWSRADQGLIRFVGDLARLRTRIPALHQLSWLTGKNVAHPDWSDARWWTESAEPMQEIHWHDMQRQHIGLKLYAPVAADSCLTGRVLLWFNAQMLPLNLRLPPTSAGCHWQKCVDSSTLQVLLNRDDLGVMQGMTIDTSVTVPPRSVLVWVECRSDA